MPSLRQVRFAPRKRTSDAARLCSATKKSCDDLVGSAEQWQKRLLRFFHPRACRGTLAHNKENRVLLLGAIPVHLLAEMSGEATCGHGDGIGRIELITGTDPPRALEHRDETVVGMKMRATEVVTCEPFVDHDIKAGLFGSPTSTALRLPPVPFHSIWSGSL